MAKFWFLWIVLVIALVLVGTNYFGKQTRQDLPIPPPTTSPSLNQDCKVTGCNSEICAEADKADDIITDCQWKEEYACYKNARCERQSDGTCAWTKDEALTKCLNK